MNKIESSRRARILRIIGVVVLMAGIVSAGLIHRLGTRAPDASGDISMLGYDKPEMRQMELLYGKQGQLLENFSNDLKQPDTQAIIIVVFSALVAVGCFYFARLLANDDDITSEK